MSRWPNLSGHRLVRDSKLGAASPVLAVTPAEWSAFTAVVKAGRLDGWAPVTHR